MSRDSFVFRRSFYEPVRGLSNDAERGILFDAVYDYAINGIYPESLPPMLLMAFGFISSNIDRDLEKYQAVVERNQQNGKKGGRPKNPIDPKKPIGLSGMPKEPKKPDSDSDSYSVSDSGKKEKKTKVFTPPTLLDVIDFFKAKGSTEERARQAFEHYELGDWTDAKGQPVKNWKQKLSTNWIVGKSYSQPDRKPTPSEEEMYKRLD